ncbi:MAG: hypothetical protein K2L95_02885 [Alphaproteobacteria bacterium]|nr:hypothetical protein [Alphaproteobacteria bacterium]
MKKHTVFFTFAMLLGPVAADAATTCSRANLTRCLDSACAINISSNPAARCQYCGTASAGGAPADTGMRSVSVGQSASNTLTAKQLQSAPDDPGARYAWATTECMKKVAGCSLDDVADIYDPLIEQSCRAAGISAQMATLQAAARKTKSQSSCATDIRACLIDAKRCGANFAACEDNADFDKFFAACSVEATGCTNYTSAIRTDLIAARDTAIKNADAVLAGIVASYQNARDTKLKSVQNNCTNNAAREDCIKTVCERNMRNQCGANYPAEKSMATLICKFHDLACDKLKK